MSLLLESFSGEPAAEDHAPALPVIQSALGGAVCFSEALLRAVGLGGTRLSRVICTPDARHWTLAFAEYFFEVEVLDDGFSVRSVEAP